MQKKKKVSWLWKQHSKTKLWDHINSYDSRINRNSMPRSSKKKDGATILVCNSYYISIPSIFLFKSLDLLILHVSSSTKPFCSPVCFSVWHLPNPKMDRLKSSLFQAVLDLWQWPSGSIKNHQQEFYISMWVSKRRKSLAEHFSRKTMQLTASNCTKMHGEVFSAASGDESGG